MLLTVKMSSLLAFISMTLAYEKNRPPANDLQKHIASGKDANIEDYPYFIRLFVHMQQNSVSCGGCYIRPRWVLTASHCLDINNDDNTKIPHIGEDKTRAKCLAGLRDSQKAGYQAISSVNLFLNPNYFRNETDVLNDIGLIELQYPFEMKSTVKLIAMPASKMDYTGKTMLIMGYGNAGVDEDPAEINNTSPRKLQTLETTVHDMEKCTERLGSPSAICLGKKDSENKMEKCLKRISSPSAICLGEKGEITCSGDSGGPLVFQKLVIGISSFNFGCSGEYAVYENVYSHRNWINEVAGKPTCKPCKAGQIASCSYHVISYIIIIFLRT